MTRPIYEIARDIMRDPSLDRTSRNTAGPYLSAMLTLSQPSDVYFNERASDISRYALNNLKTWRGATASALKAELRAAL